ncbi:NAD-binding protein, partial [Lactococcus lactis]|uniref:NAD-binding protein n=1 Tax=Lactococcus lactis TaxID=1358 RepID=UPI003D0E4937
NLFFVGSVVTLALSPTVITSVPKLLILFPHFRLLKSAQDVQVDAQVGLKDHLILCGFGRMGRSIGMSLHSQKIPFVVIEVNGQAIEELGLHGI